MNINQKNPYLACQVLVAGFRYFLVYTAWCIDRPLTSSVHRVPILVECLFRATCQETARPSVCPSRSPPKESSLRIIHQRLLDLMAE
jgi:hypothetical protein